MSCTFFYLFGGTGSNVISSEQWNLTYCDATLTKFFESSMILFFFSSDATRDAITLASSIYEKQLDQITN